MEQSDGRCARPQPKAQTKRLNASEGYERPILTSADQKLKQIAAKLETADNALENATANFLNSF